MRSMRRPSVLLTMEKWSLMRAVWMSVVVSLRPSEPSPGASRRRLRASPEPKFTVLPVGMKLNPDSTPAG